MVDEVVFKKFPDKNFNVNSLKSYNRYQETEVNLRFVEGKYICKDEPFIEDWNDTELKKRAENILYAMEKNSIGYVVYYKNKVIGFAYLGTEVFGSKNQYIELIMFHVSNEFRNQKIGKKLFNLICEDARKLKVQKLYISANSAIETQKAYKALGCIFASEINKKIIESNPFDVQLEYIL